MRLLLKLLAIVILGPVALLILLLGGIAAIVGLPLLWESAVRKYTTPPEGS